MLGQSVHKQSHNKHIQVLFDWHIVPTAAASIEPDAYAMQSMRDLLESRGCGTAKLAVLEENLCDAHFSRALADASAAAAIAKHLDIVEIRTTSQVTLSP